MGRHRRFTDGAGFTRHCWECEHAKGWEYRHTILGHSATCERTGSTVYKYDSPNNQCSHLPIGCSYDDGGAVE